MDGVPSGGFGYEPRGHSMLAPSELKRKSK